MWTRVFSWRITTHLVALSEQEKIYRLTAQIFHCYRNRAITEFPIYHIVIQVPSLNANLSNASSQKTMNWIWFDYVMWLMCCLVSVKWMSETFRLCYMFNVLVELEMLTGFLNNKIDENLPGSFNYRQSSSLKAYMPLVPFSRLSKSWSRCVKLMLQVFSLLPSFVNKF